VNRLRSIPIGRLARRGVALAMVGTALTACGSWRGIANVPIPGGTDTGAGQMTIYAQMPDTLALNVLIRHVGAWRLPAAVVMARQPEVFLRAAVGEGAVA
jgi:hypothetical protein